MIVIPTDIVIFEYIINFRHFVNFIQIYIFGILTSDKIFLIFEILTIKAFTGIN